MGLDNRDYARDRFSSDRGGWGAGGGRSRGGFRDWEVWKKIIAVNVIVFLLQIFFTRPATIEDLRESAYFDPQQMVDDQAGEFAANDSWDSESITPATLDQLQAWMPPVSVVQKWLELDSEKVQSGQLWRLITSGFCHDRGSLWHLLFNMLFLFWFGSRLELRFGSKEFTAFYFAALLSASVAYLLLDIYTGTLIPAIGASGAVWGVLALYALLYPYEKIYVYFLFPVEIRFLAIIYFLFDLYPVLLAVSGETQHSGIAHAAHVGGAVFGFLYWKFHWRLMPGIERLQTKVPRRTQPSRGDGPRPRVLKLPRRGEAPANHQQQTSELDAILAKLSSEGRAALTDDELEWLEQASRQLRETREQQDR